MSAPSGLSERVLRALAAGKSREDVVGELVAEGLSRPTAERFVDRALGPPVLPRGEPAAPKRYGAREDSGGRGPLVSGAFGFSLGGTITAVTFLLASPGQEYVIAYGAVLVGLLAFGRGLMRWRETDEPFPAGAVFVAAAVPPAFALVLLGSISGRQWARRSGEAARLEEARKVQEELQAASQRKADEEARAQRHADRITEARDRLLSSTQPMTRCDAALDLGHARAREAIPDLIGVLRRATEHASVRNCAAGALVEMGETKEPLAFYLECARAGTSERRRIALGGFGDIGPPAAELALPYLREALESPHWDLRYLAVETLAKLGPLAEPLLRDAAEDGDPRIRERAEKALGR